MAIELRPLSRQTLLMDLGTAVFTLITLVVGAALTFLTTWLTNRSADAKADAREARADEKQRHATGREHARIALDIVRKARTEFVRRRPEGGSRGIDVDDLRLDDAEAAIELVPDPILRPRLTSVISLVQFPWTLSNSSFGEGYPVDLQRRGLWLVQEGLAAYLREEPTPAERDALGVLAKANDDAHEEHREWEEERQKEQAERAKSGKKRKRPTS